MRVKELFEEIKKHTYIVYSPIDSWEERPLKTIATTEYYDYSIVSEEGDNTGSNRYKNHFKFVEWCKDYETAKKKIEKMPSKNIKYWAIKIKSK